MEDWIFHTQEYIFMTDRMLDAYCHMKGATYRDASNAEHLQDEFATTCSQIMTQLAQVILITAATDWRQVVLKFTDQYTTHMTQAAVLPTHTLPLTHSARGLSTETNNGNRLLCM